MNHAEMIYIRNASCIAGILDREATEQKQKTEHDKMKKMVVVIEYRPRFKAVTVRGVWEESEFVSGLCPLLEPENQQNEVHCFLGVDHKARVSLSGLIPG